jgi:hypothetical protein
VQSSGRWRSSPTGRQQGQRRRQPPVYTCSAGFFVFDDLVVILASSLKIRRRIATRYDRRAQDYRPGLTLPAGITPWSST